MMAFGNFYCLVFLYLSIILLFTVRANEIPADCASSEVVCIGDDDGDFPDFSTALLEFKPGDGKAFLLLKKDVVLENEIVISPYLTSGTFEKRILVTKHPSITQNCKITTTMEYTGEHMLKIEQKWWKFAEIDFHYAGKLASSSSGFSVILISGASRGKTVIENINLRNDGGVNSTGIFIQCLQGCRDVLFDEIYVNNVSFLGSMVGYIGIKVEIHESADYSRTQKFHFNQLHFDVQNEVGVHGVVGNNGLISNCEFTSRKYGVYWENSTFYGHEDTQKIVIDSCEFSIHNTYAIDFEGFVSNLIIQKSTFSQCGIACIVLKHPKEATIHQNNFVSPTGSILWLYKCSDPGEFTITNNYWSIADNALSISELCMDTKYYIANNIFEKVTGDNVPFYSIGAITGAGTKFRGSTVNNLFICNDVSSEVLFQLSWFHYSEKPMADHQFIANVFHNCLHNDNFTPFFVTGPDVEHEVNDIFDGGQFIGNYLDSGSQQLICRDKCGSFMHTNNIIGDPIVLSEVGEKPDPYFRATEAIRPDVPEGIFANTNTDPFYRSPSFDFAMHTRNHVFYSAGPFSYHSCNGLPSNVYDEDSETCTCDSSKAHYEPPTCSGHCRVDSGFDNGNNCLTCLMHLAYNYVTDECVCPTHYENFPACDECVYPKREIPEIFGMCTCAENYVLNERTNFCECRPGFGWESNCTLCSTRPGTHFVLNVDDNLCECEENFELPDCNYCKQGFDIDSNCVDCLSGFRKEGEDCEAITECPPNMENNPPACDECVKGYEFDEDGVSCVKTKKKEDDDKKKDKQQVGAIVGSVVGGVSFVVIVVVILVILVAIIIVVVKVKKKSKKEGSQRQGSVELVDVENDSERASLRIDQKLFEVDMKDVKITSQIGEGGGGAQIFLAEWQGEKVAFKIFKVSSFNESTNDFTEFENEVKLMGSISHPNILRFYGASLDKPRIGIIMEFCPNGDLYTFLCKGKGKEFGVDERLRILLGIAKGVNFVHSKSIIHRDLKPENVLIDDRFCPKLIDFGLSKIINRNNLTKHTRAIGTTYFIAPEVILGGHYSTKVDCFSFAIIMFMVIFDIWTPYGPLKDIQGTIELRVANNNDFRPQFPENHDKPDWIVDCIKNGWSHDCEIRNSMKQVVEILSKNS